MVGFSHHIVNTFTWENKDHPRSDGLRGHISGYIFLSIGKPNPSGGKIATWRSAYRAPLSYGTPAARGAWLRLLENASTTSVAMKGTIL